MWERLAVTPESACGARPRAKRGEIALSQLYGFHWGWAVLVRANLMELSLLKAGPEFNRYFAITHLHEVWGVRACACLCANKCVSLCLLLFKT